MQTTVRVKLCGQALRRVSKPLVIHLELGIRPAIAVVDDQDQQLLRSACPSRSDNGLDVTGDRDSGSPFSNTG